MTLNLNGRTFPIEKATLSGWLNATKQDYSVGLGWTIEIQCAEAIYDDEVWRPCLTFEEHLDVRRWIDFSGMTYSWDDPKDGSPYARFSFYAWEHGAMSRGVVRIGERTGLDFDVELSGLCDVHWDDDQFGKDVVFHVRCPVCFTGIDVLGDADQTADSLRQSLAREFDLTDVTLRSQEPFPPRGHPPGVLRIISEIIPALKPKPQLLVRFAPIETSTAP